MKENEKLMFHKTVADEGVPMGTKCKDCVYYIQHYSKCRGQFRSVLCGHCMNKKSSGHFRKTDIICELFQGRDLKKEKDEQIKSATEWLYFIGERLNELTQILKDNAE